MNLILYETIGAIHGRKILRFMFIPLYAISFIYFVVVNVHGFSEDRKLSHTGQDYDKPHFNNSFQTEGIFLNNQSKMEPPNRLAGDEGFKGKTILITGASGFVGKVLLEKLLRTCPLVKRIYVIIRVKRGKEPQTRLNEMFDGPLFNLLKKTQGEEVLKRVLAIPGDVAEVNLGLSQENWNLLTEESQIIFHLAATIRFDDPLKKTVLLNSRGTKILLELAKQCKKLLAFVHISTTYCHPQEKVLHEKMYPAPANPEEIIKVVEVLDEDALELISKRLRGNHPNTYTYAKALAEGLVNNEIDNLPVIILRPSVVIPVWLEPMPGWTDNINGPAGLLMAAGKGICRTMYCNPNTCCDFIPVDIVANGILLATYDYMVHQERRIFNLATSSRVKLTLSEIIDLGRKIITTRMPFNWVVWYPGGTLKSSRLIHNICVILFHYIPAVILDGLIILSGNKPVVWKIQRRISKGFELLEYYANNQWDFIAENVSVVAQLSNDTEKKVYKANEDGFDAEEYYYHAIYSTRVNVLKETDESLPTARRHMMVMWVVDKICKFLILLGFGHLLMKYFVHPVINMFF